MFRKTGNSLYYLNLLVLKDIPDNISVNTEISNLKGIFLNISAEREFSSKTFILGKMSSMDKFASCFRIKACWMQPKISDSVTNIPADTQFIIAQSEKEGEELYTLVIPLIDGALRCSLEGEKDGNILLNACSGDSGTVTKKVCGIYFITGSDPYELIKTAAKEICLKLGTVSLRYQKKLPDYINYYGWCSYNAFYSEISHDKILNLLENYYKNGYSPRFVIIDAGWQRTNDRILLGFEEDRIKFPEGLAGTIRLAKEKYGVKMFLIWHAFCGFWRGISKEGFTEYDVREIKANKRNTGIELKAETNDDNEKIDLATVGPKFYPAYDSAWLPHPDFSEFYMGFHDYLKKQGADGVKVDAISWVEMYGEGSGGRVKKMKDLISSAEESADKFFNGNLLYCSSCSNDYIFNTQRANVTRTSPDFIPQKPETHGIHIFTNAHTAFWMGEFLLPDWDMFQSGHEAGEFHAAARAISGGPVYSTDEPGKEDFNIIAGLCFSDGTVPGCISHAMICKDSFFTDPREDKKLIKIFNQNKYGGVIGVFNCCYSEKKNESVLIEGYVSPSDVHGIKGDRFAVYSRSSKKLVELGVNEKTKLKLGQLGSDLFAVVPIENNFAPIGLINFYNSGGTIDNYYATDNECILMLRDKGTFLAYSGKMPVKVTMNGAGIPFEYNESNKTLLIEITSAGMSEIIIRW